MLSSFHAIQEPFSRRRYKEIAPVLKDDDLEINDGSVWPSSVCSDAPVVASQSRTVQSSEADASRVPSVEKATDVTACVWPSSVCRHALQLLFIIGFVIIQPGSSSLNSSLVKLHVGLNIRANAYA
jgi:hypothetical protein